MTQGFAPPLYAALAEACANAPEQDAIVSMQETLSYAALLRRIEQLACWIRTLGIQPLEKIAWAASNTSSFFELLYATWLVGAVGVPLDMHAPPEQWSGQCSNCDVHLLLLPPDGLVKGMDAFRQCPALQSIGTVTAQDGKLVLTKELQRAGAHDPGDSQPGDALILGTSGTTRFPKGVVLTATGLDANQKAVSQALRIAAQDTLLLVKPFHHSSTLIEALAVLSTGGRLILQPWLTARGLVSLARMNTASLLCLVPAMVHDLLAYLRDEHEALPFRLLSVSGAPIASRVLRELSGYTPQGGVCQAYGLTEASPRVSILLPPEIQEREQSVGRPVAQVSVAVIDEHGTPQVAGKRGELVVRGPNVMRGYYNQPDASAHVLRQGWLHTGDLAHLDLDGYIYLHGRLDDQLNCGGQKMYPGEIEQVLLEHPAVLEALVCAVADDRLGYIPVAYLLPSASGPVEEKEIRRFCYERLPAYKVPRRMQWCRDLPRTSSGKVRRTATLHEFSLLSDS